MFVLPGIFGLIIAIYMRPHEWSPDLAAIPVVQIAMALAVLGLLADILGGDARLSAVPTLLPAALLTIWLLITLGIHEPDLVASHVTPALLPFVVYAIFTQGVQTTRALLRVCVGLLVVGLFLAVVSVQQGQSEWGCVRVDPATPAARGVADGRLCEVDEDHTPREAAAGCSLGGEIDAVYNCERVGAFSTVTVDSGRIAYLGVLADPNELALAIALAVPFAFALFEIRKTFTRLALLLASLGFGAVALVLTRSRGGQIALAGVLGAYFIRRQGAVRGGIVAAALAAPLVVLGGRSGESAEQSSIDRLTTAGAGLKLLLAYPLRGVGYSLYTNHHHLTAHNAYILAAAELGLLGLVLFCLLILLSFKITVAVLNHPFAASDPEGRVLRALAMAELGALTGLLLGVFFLSWTYHFVLWIHLGVASALFTVMRRKCPHFKVITSPGDLVTVVIVPVVVLAVYAVHIMRMGCW